MKKGSGLSQWEERERRRRFSFRNHIGAPAMTLGTIGNPFFRFPLAAGADKGKIGGSAQLKGLFKLLGRPAEVFLMEIDLCQKSVQGREILSLEADQIELLKGFIEHLEPQTKLGIEKGITSLLAIGFHGSLIDSEKRIRVSPLQVEVFETKQKDDRLESFESLSPDISGHPSISPCAGKYLPGGDSQGEISSPPERSSFASLRIASEGSPPLLFKSSFACSYFNPR